MSQKYPEGAIIVNKQGKKLKILGCAGEVIFVSKIADFLHASVNDICTDLSLEENGWTVEETPWVPKEGEEYEFLDSKAQVCVTVNKLSYFDSQLIELGNCYKPGTGQAQAAAIRVKAAYKGEK